HPSIELDEISNFSTTAKSKLSHQENVTNVSIELFQPHKKAPLQAKNQEVYRAIIVDELEEQFKNDLKVITLDDSFDEYQPELESGEEFPTVSSAQEQVNLMKVDLTGTIDDFCKEE